MCIQSACAERGGLRSAETEGLQRGEIRDREDRYEVSDGGDLCCFNK